MNGVIDGSFELMYVYIDIYIYWIFNQYVLVRNIIKIFICEK